VLSLTINELFHSFLAVITLYMCFNKKLHRAWLVSKNHSYNKKILLDKYIYKKHKQNRATSVRGNIIVNTLVLVIRTGLWPLNETRGHHVLNVFRPYNFWDVRRSKIIPNHHVIPTWKLSLFCICFDFFCVSYQKSRNLYDKWIIC
jgi:hypothetical protein